jgi:hypothetical protein
MLSSRSRTLGGEGCPRLDIPITAKTRNICAVPRRCLPQPHVGSSRTAQERSGAADTPLAQPAGLVITVRSRASVLRCAADRCCRTDPPLEPRTGRNGAMSHPVDITDQRFNRLIAIRPVGSDDRGKRLWLCRCDCGKEKVIRRDDLRYNRTQSCGCLQKERQRANRTHGESSHGFLSSEYASWGAMLTRCRNPRFPTFKYYGGRGIKVCKRWLRYENFLVDMGRRPSPKHRLDRIDVNGNYEPSNCRWGTPKQHQQNKRPRRKVGAIDRFTTAELKAELARRAKR